jgi:hypothetical protein
MNDKHDEIDALLRQNIERQLADFDWAGLRKGIAGRVTAAGVRSSSWNRYGRWVAMAASIALAVGVLTPVMIRTTQLGGPSAGNAIVAMVEATHPAGSAQVSFSLASKPARCEVEILPSDKPRQQDGARASWCIIAKQEPSPERRYDGRDVSDVVCLF